MYIFNFYYLEHSIIVKHFRHYFDKRYCLLLRLIIVMVEFGHFIPLIWHMSITITHVRSWYCLGHLPLLSCFIKLPIIATSHCLIIKCPYKHSKQYLPRSVCVCVCLTSHQQLRSWRRGLCLMSLLTNWWSQGSNLRPLVYKASG